MCVHVYAYVYGCGTLPCHSFCLKALESNASRRTELTCRCLGSKYPKFQDSGPRNLILNGFWGASHIGQARPLEKYYLDTFGTQVGSLEKGPPYEDQFSSMAAFGFGNLEAMRQVLNKPRRPVLALLGWGEEGSFLDFCLL